MPTTLPVVFEFHEVEIIVDAELASDRLDMFCVYAPTSMLTEQFATDALALVVGLTDIITAADFALTGAGTLTYWSMSDELTFAPIVVNCADGNIQWEIVCCPTLTVIPPPPPPPSGAIEAS
jgi:hypothetical protein